MAKKILIIGDDAVINILGISTSISSVSCIIAEKEMNKAKTVLEEAFELPN